jgi:7-cyano-7-deazaguanine synthase
MTSTTKVFTLLSGGADSTTTLAIAAQDFPDSEIECVSIDYGQRHAKEMECASFIAQQYGASHIILNLSGLLQGMLVEKGQDNEEIPNASYADLPVGISPTYVSFRNGTMLSLLAARAQAWVMAMEKAGEAAEAVIYCGVHADDGVNWAYPDCTPEFIGSMASAILVGTYNKVRLRAPLQYMNKQQVIRTGIELGTPLSHTWSCYKGEEMHCGTCPTCRSRKQAFLDLNAAEFDVQYASDQQEAA